VLLRLGLWSRGGFSITQPLLRQLCRLAGERPEQWTRTDALLRLIDAMLDEFPWRSSSCSAALSSSSALPSIPHANRPATPSSDVAPSPAGPVSPPADVDATPDATLAATPAAMPAATSAATPADLATPPSPRVSPADIELCALWDGAFDVLCSLADTPSGVSVHSSHGDRTPHAIRALFSLCRVLMCVVQVSASALKYIVHVTLRSGSRGVVSALVRALVART
jgi:hypothetical protein